MSDKIITAGIGQEYGYIYSVPEDRSAKCILLTIGGCAVIGNWGNGELGDFYLGWCPLPKTDKVKIDVISFLKSQEKVSGQYAQLVQAIIGKEKNGWIFCGNLRIYFRKSHVLNMNTSEMPFCFTIANVQSVNRGSGEFKALIAILKKLDLFDAVYIEQVINDRLSAYLETICESSFFTSPGVKSFLIACNDG